MYVIKIKIFVVATKENLLSWNSSQSTTEYQHWRHYLFIFQKSRNGYNLWI